MGQEVGSAGSGAEKPLILPETPPASASESYPDSSRKELLAQKTLILQELNGLNIQNKANDLLGSEQTSHIFNDMVDYEHMLDRLGVPPGDAPIVEQSEAIQNLQDILLNMRNISSILNGTASSELINDPSYIGKKTSELAQSLKDNYAEVVRLVKQFSGGEATQADKTSFPDSISPSFFAPRMEELANQIINERTKIIDPINDIRSCNSYIGWDHSAVFPRDDSRRNDALIILTTTKQMKDQISQLQDYMSIMPTEYQDAFNLDKNPLNDLKTGVQSINDLADNEVNGIDINGENKILSELKPYELSPSSIRANYPSLSYPGETTDNWKVRFDHINSALFTDVLNFDFANGKYPENTTPT